MSAPFTVSGRERQTFKVTSQGLPVVVVEYTYSDHFSLRAWVAAPGGRVVRLSFPFLGEYTASQSTRVACAVDAAMAARG